MGSSRPLTAWFFSKRGDRLTFMCSICCGVVSFLQEADICFKPGEMWALVGQRILYYGPGLGKAVHSVLAPGLWMLKNNAPLEALGWCYLRARGEAQALLFACLAQPKHIKTLVEEGGLSVECRDAASRTPLMVATAMLNEASVSALLECGADPNAVCGGEQQNSAFFLVKGSPVKTPKRRQQMLSILTRLLEAGLDLSLRDRRSRISLLHPDLLHCLPSSFLGQHLQAIAPSPLNGYTPLHYILESNNHFNRAEHTEGLLEALLDMDVDVQSTVGVTPLMIAAFKGSHRIMEALKRKHGADTQIKDNKGRGYEQYREHVSPAILFL
jgi:hypothetical protein